MKFNIVNNVNKIYDFTIVPCFKDLNDEKYSDVLNKLKEDKVFLCKKSTSYKMTKYENNEITNIIFLGLGDKDKINYEVLYQSVVSSFKNLKFTKDVKFLINLFETSNLNIDNVAKAFVLAANACQYKFTKYIGKNDEEHNIEIDLYDEKLSLKQESLNESLNINYAVNLTRDLVNEPANVLTPEEFSNRCIEAVKDLNVEIDVYDEAWIKENGLHSFYEVGKASANKPRFIVMKYFGDKESKDSISFVGKGITYDSGGYSIKSSDGMVTMKCDMAGAATVVSLMTILAKENIKLNVYGIIPACENLINGNGFKPGDIINSLSGKTIEILSTDAEGRLILADGVYYAANKLNSNIIIDIATLTGACGIALGTKYAAIIDNNEKVYEKLNSSMENTVEKIWRLPADEEYKELIKSDVADLKNLGGRYGGTITGGLFVGEFADNKPWAHLDIAYVAWNDFPSKIYPKKGATGAGVELLYQFCKNNQK